MQLVELQLGMDSGIKVRQIESRMSSLDKKSCQGREMNWLVMALVLVS